MALTQRGIVYKVGATETRQYKDKTFVSRVLVIEQPSYDPYTGEKRNSNFIKLEATKEDTCKALDNFTAGTKVDVEFIVRGTKYDKKDGSGEDVFTHIELRSIALAGAAPAGGAQAPAGDSSDYDDSLGF